MMFSKTCPYKKNNKNNKVSVYVYVGFIKLFCYSGWARPLEENNEWYGPRFFVAISQWIKVFAKTFIPNEYHTL